MAHTYLGVAFMSLRRFTDALESFERALRLQPRSCDSAFQPGIALAQLHRLDDAVRSYDRAIELRPDHLDAHRNRGNALRELKRREAALKGYDAAIRVNPNEAQAYNSRGVTLRELLRFDEALADYERALAVDPHFADADYNRGVALKDLQAWDAALASYETAIELDPGHAKAIAGRGILRLLRGDFARGWADYEWRFANGNCAPMPEERSFSRPRWRGDRSIAGKTILVHAEQGLGDTLQFCRYAALMANLGARVILEVQPRLMGVMSSVVGVWMLAARGDSLPEFDNHCPLLSLPQAFNTHLGNLPADVPYLAAPPAPDCEVAGATGTKDPSPHRGGLARKPTISDNHHRSFALADLLRHLPAHCEVISLQKS